MKVEAPKKGERVMKARHVTGFLAAIATAATVVSAASPLCPLLAALHPTAGIVCQAVTGIAIATKAATDKPQVETAPDMGTYQHEGPLPCCNRLLNGDTVWRTSGAVCQCVSTLPDGICGRWGDPIDGGPEGCTD